MLVILCCSAMGMQAQEETIIKDRLPVKTGAWGGTHHSLSQMADETAVVNGFLISTEYGRSLFLGYNFNWMGSELRPDGLERSVNMNWHSFQLGYAFGAEKSIHPIVHFDVGRGRLKDAETGKDRFFLFQPTAGVEFNLYRWFHLSVEGGYRLTSGIGKNGLSDSDFSSPMGQLSLKFGWSWGEEEE